VKKVKFIITWALGVLLIIIVSQFSASAHVPPVNGATDCGIIQDGLFYSDYYSPPAGTPAVNGSCSWVKQGSSICAVRNYGGTNYNLYNYKWICNVPLDSNIYILMFVIAIFGYFKLYRPRNFFKANYKIVN